MYLRSSLISISAKLSILFFLQRSSKENYLTKLSSVNALSARIPSQVFYLYFHVQILLRLLVALVLVNVTSLNVRF